MINIVLVEPEIPQNTGNISRTCACTGSKLHLVRPFGFEISDRTVKRAGLDYWDKVDISYYCSTKAKKRYSDIKFEDGCFLLFGKETKGLPPQLVYDNPETALRIPMNGVCRSLNLSNSVAIVLYEALRQLDFDIEQLH